MVRVRLLITIWFALASAAAISAPIPDVNPSAETSPGVVPKRPEPVTAGSNESSVPSDDTLWTIDSRLQTPAARRARRAFELGEIDACLKHLSEVVAEHPSLPPPRVLAAQVYLTQGKTAAAMQLLEQAAWRHQDEPEVFIMLGQIELQAGRLANAWMHYERALSLGTPDWSPEQQARLQLAGSQGLAVVAERRGDWESAATALKNCANLQPGDAGVLDRWGKALFLSGSLAEAEQKFAAAFRRNPTMRPPELSMAVMFSKQNDFAQGETWYNKAVAEYPNNGIVHFEFAAALLREGLTQRALQEVELAERATLPVERLKVELKMIRGIVAMSAEDFETAEKCFTEVLQQSPGHRQALRRLPLALVEQQDESKQQCALQIATIGAKKDSNSGESFATLAWVQFRSNHIDDARQALAQCPTPADPESLYFLSRVMFATGEFNKAAPLVRSLSVALKNPGWFPHRKEAQEWVDSVILTLD